MAADFLNVTLAQGDHVVFIQNGYREFSVGTISRVTPKKVEVSFTNRYGKLDSTLRFPEDVVRV